MKQFDKTKAKELAERIKSAQADLSSYLKECFPIGAPCSVMLAFGQKTPTHGTIAGFQPNIYGGQVTVEINGSKARGSRRFRSVAARAVTVMDGSANPNPGPTPQVTAVPTTSPGGLALLAVMVALAAGAARKRNHRRADAATGQRSSQEDAQ